MNKVEAGKVTLLSRLKDAIKVFRGNPVCTITYGVKLTRCAECENNIRCEECANNKEGYWKKADIPCEDFVCSVCGGGAWYYGHDSVQKSRFCPNCGARMRGIK